MKYIEKNIGKKDRIIRLVISIILFSMIGLIDNKFIQWILFILSIASLLQAIVGWCGLYAFLGKNTCPVK